MRILIICFGLFICSISFADTYAVYNNDGDIVNVIAYDGIAEYNEKVFHGSDAKMLLLGKTDLGENVGIGDTYTNGKFEKSVLIQ